MSETISTGVALARLQVSYGMTEYGAGQLLASARQDGTAERVAVTASLATMYPEAFTLEAAGDLQAYDVTIGTVHVYVQAPDEDTAIARARAEEIACGRSPEDVHAAEVTVTAI